MKKCLLLLVLFTTFYIFNAPLFAQSTTLAPNYIVIPGVAALPSCANLDKGKTVFNTTDKKMYYCDGTAWQSMAGVSSAGVGWSQTGADIANTNSGFVGIGEPNPTEKIQVNNGNMKIGKNEWNSTSDDVFLKFGDYNYVTIGEVGGDDKMEVKASEITLKTDGGNVLMPFGNIAIGTGASVVQNKVQIGNAPGFSGNILALGNGTQGMSFALTPSAAIWYTNTNFAMMPASGVGYLGIGTTNPIAPLHIQGSSLVNTSCGYFFSATSPLASTCLPTSTASILTSGAIITKNAIEAYVTVTASDSRIKNIIGLSENKDDLNTLKKIEITNYKMKDVTTWGQQTFKKVIAQQVETVYPEAIKKQTSVIPDIYALAESVSYDASTKNLRVTLAKDYGIKVSNKIELIHPQKGEILSEVVAVSGNTFTVKDWEYPTDKIFVFGREVNDFRSVDYEALSMLGISAIQALAKENEEMKKENAEMKKENAEMKKNFSARLEKLEANLIIPSGK